jgi:hypothetical protein
MSDESTGRRAAKQGGPVVGAPAGAAKQLDPVKERRERVTAAVMLLVSFGASVAVSWHSGETATAEESQSAE